MRIANEDELLADISLVLPAQRRILVFSPHPDDEVFGCGGTLCLLRDSGAEVSIVILTDGALGGGDDEDIVRTRALESREALSILGLPAPEFWGLPDRGLKYGEPLVERLVGKIKASRAELVFFPAPTEIHPDHQCLALAGMEALRRVGDSLQGAFYEISSPLPNPNLLLDISGCEQRKSAAMDCFHSQLDQQPYADRINGLNTYRAFRLGPQVSCAEAFATFPCSDMDRVVPALFAGSLHQRLKSGFAVTASDIPLVSIVVRSMDLSTLGEALDSLALQTYANIEVVVVNAKGGQHSPLAKTCGPFPLRLVNQAGEPLARSRAANVGLAACQGRYLGFLDDDDVIAPDHIHHLVDLLQKNKDKVVTYAGVEGIRRDDPRREVLHIFAEKEVSFPLLLMGNVIPIHAALFPAELLKKGISVDETLELFEDWDLWLQMIRLVPFKYVDRITATYYSDGSSQVFPHNPDSSSVSMAKDALFTKWSRFLGTVELQEIVNFYHQVQTISAVRIENSAQRLQAVETRLNQLIAERDDEIVGLNQLVAERDDEIVGLNQLVAERDDQLTGLDQLVSERDAEIRELLVSNSWRLMAPLRTVAILLRKLKAFCCLIPRAVRQCGGFFQMGIKTIEVFKLEGLTGLRQRLRTIQKLEIQPIVCVENGKEVDRNDYTEWIKRYDTLTDENHIGMLRQIERFTRKPLISVVMPTYNSKPEWLVEAIESVRAQIYPNWELCIADDASTNNAIRPILERYAEEDPRIKVVFRKENGHISAASNSAIELVTGKYIALLDHDDLLPEHALFWVVDTINRHPDAQLIYSDEDKINPEGQRSDPYFKCEWNQDLFYSHNMFSHLGIYRTELIQKVEGFRIGFEGSQDYDLALRCIEKVEPEQILHIPRVLYHWRVHAESTAQGSEAKPYAILAGEKSINEHFTRRGIAANVEHVGCGYRAHYLLPDSPPLVSLIIPTRDSLQLVRQCVDSIISKTCYPNYEIIIVDNGSTDTDLLYYFKEIVNTPRVRILRDDRPFNYSALNNAAVKVARGELVGLLNDDIEVISPDWLEEMVGLVLQPGVGAVGAKLWYPNDTLQHGGVILGIGGVAGHAHKYLPQGHFGYFGRAVLIQSLSAVTAACLVVRKEIYEEVNGLDEENLKVAFNDVDFCLRIREAGYRNIWTPYAELYHHESATRGCEDTLEKQARFVDEVGYVQERWGSYLLSDPAYSPNLTLEYNDFSLAWPPRIDLLSV